MWYSSNGELPYLENEADMVGFSNILNNQTMISKDGKLPTFKHLRANPIILKKPLPNATYNADNSYPHFNHLDRLSYPFLKDFPNGLFVSKIQKIPVMTHLKKLPLLGIAKDSSISKVIFPDSLKEIFEGSFYNTNLEEVNLHIDTKYFSDSFPQSTKIKGGKLEESDLYETE